VFELLLDDMIVPVSKMLGEAFVEPYCASYDIPYSGDSSQGYDTHWFGYFRKGKISAVLGVIQINGYDYVHGFYGDKRGLVKLWHWSHKNFPNMIGKVTKLNYKMLNFLTKHGWEVYKEWPDCSWVRCKSGRSI
jgi:hypothetical protein